MARFAPYSHWLVVLFLFPLAQVAAAPVSEALLPDSTKGFVAIPSVAELREKFNQTQFGLMVHDEAMKPFMEDLQAQIKDKLIRTGVKLAITMDDLRDVASGEIAVAAIQPTAGDKNSHAEVLLVDITGNEAKARQLMEKIGKSQTARGAARTARQYSGVDMVLYALPLRPNQTVGDYGVYFIRDNHLVVTDHIAVAVDIAARFGKTTQPSLLDQPAYKFIMDRHQQEAGELKPQVRWFIEPFGYAEVTRAMAEGPKKRGTDLNQPLEFLGRVLSHRAIIVVLSDFQGQTALTRREIDAHLRRQVVLSQSLSQTSLGALRQANRRHDVVAVQIVDRYELMLPDLGYLVLKDAETGEVVEINTGSERRRQAFAKRQANAQQELKQLFAAASIDSIQLRTDQPYAGALGRFFEARERRRRRG